MTIVYDWSTKKSQLVIWDACSLNELLRMQLRDRVPEGFHTVFVEE